MSGKGHIGGRSLEMAPRISWAKDVLGWDALERNVNAEIGESDS